jgi:hypothetical protein
MNRADRPRSGAATPPPVLTRASNVAPPASRARTLVGDPLMLRGSLK